MQTPQARPPAYDLPPVQNQLLFRRGGEKGWPADATLSAAPGATSLGTCSLLRLHWALLRRPMPCHSAGRLPHLRVPHMTAPGKGMPGWGDTWEPRLLASSVGDRLPFGPRVGSRSASLCVATCRLRACECLRAVGVAAGSLSASRVSLEVRDSPRQHALCRWATDSSRASGRGRRAHDPPGSSLRLGGVWGGGVRSGMSRRAVRVRARVCASSARPGATDVRPATRWRFT